MTYWIVKDNQQIQVGSLDELCARRDLRTSTPVWHDGLADWTPAGNLPEVARRMGWITPAAFSGHDADPEPQAGPHAQSAPSQGGDGYQEGYRQGFNQGYNQAYGQAPKYAPGSNMGADVPPMPRNYLIWAILATLCCCLPTGIVAIIYASQVKPAYQNGDYMKAQRASSRAEAWLIASFVLGLISIPFSMMLNLF